MKKYQRLAEQIREQIASGVWQPGDRLPSLREQVASSGMSFMTVGALCLSVSRSASVSLAAIEPLSGAGQQNRDGNERHRKLAAR